MSEPTDWPALPWIEWADTGDALHLWCRILGKYRLAHTPWAVHSWHATLYVVPRGLTTGPVPDAGGDIELTLDVRDSRLVVETEGGARESFPLEPMSVADFLSRTRGAVEAVGGTFDIHGRPNPGSARSPRPTCSGARSTWPSRVSPGAPHRRIRAASRICRMP